MAAPNLLVIDAVTGVAERPVFVSACEQLGKSLGEDESSNWPIQLYLCDSVSSLDKKRKPAVILLSMIGEVARDEAIEQTKSRWQGLLSQLLQGAAPRIFLCTVFRHVANGGPRHGRDTLKKMERICRLNLMAAQLSHELGIDLIDIDRNLAHIGARTLETDYRLGGRSAAEIAGFAIALGLIDVGLDDAIPAEVLDAARERQAGSGGIRRVLIHCLEQRASHTDNDGHIEDFAVDALDQGF